MQNEFFFFNIGTKYDIIFNSDKDLHNEKLALRGESSMERLQKVIAQAGIASRRKAEQLILEGKVKVNGEVVTTLGTKVSKSDVVEVDGVKVEREEKVYYLFYKP